MATQLNLKDYSKKEDVFTHGHRMCSGCGTPIIIKQLFLASEYPIVLSNATG
jgi:pyruvate ferredoxin oxidoreductase beta subunit